MAHQNNPKSLKAHNKQADKLSEFERSIVQAMYEWQEGWRFCSEKLADTKLAEKLGVYEYGLVYSDDCACQLTVDMNSPYFGGDCGCACHKSTAELARLIAHNLTKGSDMLATDFKPSKGHSDALQ